MKIELSVREIVLGAILLTATMVLIGCVSKNPCNVDRAYDFASTISQEDPNKFAKARSNTSIIFIFLAAQNNLICSQVPLKNQDTTLPLGAGYPMECGFRYTSRTRRSCERCPPFF